MLSIISFYFFSFNTLQTFLFPLIFLFLAFSFFFALSLSAYCINPSLFIFNLAFIMNPFSSSSQQVFNRQEVSPLKTRYIPPLEMEVLCKSSMDSDDLGAYGFKPKTKTKAQGLSIYLNKTVGRTVWFQFEKHISGVADIDFKMDLSRFQEVSSQISSLMMLSTLTQRKKTFLRYWMKIRLMSLTSMLRESPI